MSMNVTIGLNEETLAALNSLTAAIVGMGTGAAPAAASVQRAAEKVPAALAKAATKTAATKTKAEEPEVEEEAAEPVTIYWFSSATNTTGKVDSEEAYKALKKKDPKTVKYTEEKYKAKLAELEAAAAEEEEEVEAEEEEVPTEQDIIAAFGAYLPADLSEEEKAERRPFVKAILDRFGAKKATALPEKHRRLAINLVQRKMAGEDVDAESDEFQAIDEDSLV